MDDGMMKKQLEILNQQMKELSSLYHAASSKFGISDSEFWVLYALSAMGGEYTQQDICDMWCLPKQTVNSVIAALRKKDYVQLETVPGTRNCKKICLTEAGKIYGENTVMHICKAEHRSVAKMPAQERETFIALLDKYITLLRRELHEI